MARNAKAKLRRIQKKYGIDLSKQIHIPKLEEFDTRADYNAWKDEMHHFKMSRQYKFKKNDKGLVASLYALDQIKQTNKLAIFAAKKRIKKAEKLPYYPKPGEQLGTVRDLFLRMHEPKKRHGIYVPTEFNFNRFGSMEELYEYVQSQLVKGSEEHYLEANARMKDNFIRALEHTFDSYADEAVKILKKMHPDEYYQMSLQYGDAFDFAAKYDRKTKTYGNMEDLKKITSYLNLYEKGEVEVDMDFSKF